MVPRRLTECFQLLPRSLFSSTGPLDRGCQGLIIPACKNLGAYNSTLISVPAQEELYSWFYGKGYAEDSAETVFPEIARKMFEQYPKCQENIKKLFCEEYLPPCFPNEDPRLYSLCQPLCDQIAIDCPGFFRYSFHNIVCLALVEIFDFLIQRFQKLQFYSFCWNSKKKSRV